MSHLSCPFLFPPSTTKNHKLQAAEADLSHPFLSLELVAHPAVGLSLTTPAVKLKLPERNGETAVGMLKAGILHCILYREQRRLLCGCLGFPMPPFPHDSRSIHRSFLLSSSIAHCSPFLSENEILYKSALRCIHIVTTALCCWMDPLTFAGDGPIDVRWGAPVFISDILQCQETPHFDCSSQETHLHYWARRCCFLLQMINMLRVNKFPTPLNPNQGADNSRADKSS